MTKSLFAVFSLMSLPLISLASDANDQTSVNECIGAWGAKSPFRKGTPAEKVITGGVKVFGIGKSTGSDEPTSKPSLILVRPAVNVLGKSTMRLSNPNGWYCFKVNVTVMGRLTVEAHCKARLASAKGEGVTVGAADDGQKGVAVFGALRVTRFGCEDERRK